jgi:hypothetical protein
MELSSEQINAVIQILDKADGEDVHEILKQSNWSEQMLKQLIITENIETVEYWYQQRKIIDQSKDQLNSQFHLIRQMEFKTVIFDFEDNENDYVVIYNEDGGDFWKPVWDIRCDGDEVEEDEIREKLISLAKESMSLID